MKEYKEIALIAVVMSDSVMQTLYKKTLRPYFNAIDIISDWAVEFYQQHSHVEDWDLFVNQEGHICWDDYVADYAMKKLQEAKV